MLACHQVKRCCQEDGAAKIAVALLRRRQRLDKALLVGGQRCAHALVMSCAPKLHQDGGRPQQQYASLVGRLGQDMPGLAETSLIQGGTALRLLQLAGSTPVVPACLPAWPTWMHKSRAVALLVTPRTFCRAALALR